MTKPTTRNRLNNVLIRAAGHSWPATGRPLALLGWIIACSFFQGAASAQMKSAVSKSATATAAGKPATATATGKASTAAAAAAAPAPAPKATETSAEKSKGAAAAASATKSVVPANLFATNDSAIIIVGGKQVKAATVKKAFNDELARLSGPPTSGSVAPRAKPATAPQAPAVDPMPTLGKGVFWQGPSVLPVALPPKGKSPSARIDMTTTPKTCKNLPPVIIEVTTFSLGGGALKKTHALGPGNTVTIDGNCFGDKQGSVEVTGPFGPSGKLSLVPVRWQNDQVLVQLPQMRGVLDGAMSVVVTSAEGRHTEPQSAKFVAARAVVAVPAQAFTPGPTLDRTDAPQTLSVTWPSGISWGAAPGQVPPNSSPLTVSVDPACSLESLSWDAKVGAVEQVIGWNDKPPYHIAKTQVLWRPQCTTTTEKYLFGSSATTVCRVAVDFQATASCPLGFGP